MRNVIINGIINYCSIYVCVFDFVFVLRTRLMIERMMQSKLIEVL